MIPRTGTPGALPKEWAYRAVVFLDPGVSVDHSMFLDVYRRWVRDSIASRCNMDISRVRPRCYILHSEEEHGKRYGLGKTLDAEVPDHWNQWEVRPRKWNPKTIQHKTRKSGLAATFCRMEINSHKAGLMAPWRYTPYGDAQPRHDRRALGVMLEPSPLDLQFFHEKEYLWHRFLVMPRLYLGAQALGRLPPTFMRWLYGVLALTPAGFSYAEAALAPFEDVGVYAVNSHRFLTKGQPKYDFGVADNWDSAGRRTRMPGSAQSILNWAGFGQKRIYQPPTGDRWDTLAEAINARVYLVLSQNEGMVPYDALLALAGGAIVVGPNTPVWKSVQSYAPKKVVLYPTRPQGHNRCLWAAQDVAAHLKATLKDRAAQKWPPPAALPQEPMIRA